MVVYFNLFLSDFIINRNKVLKKRDQELLINNKPYDTRYLIAVCYEKGWGIGYNSSNISYRIFLEFKTKSIYFPKKKIFIGM